MKNPLVSINIPVYKVEKYITRCLESVVNQSYKNIEIVLVNDCSPDKSMEIAEEFFKKHPQFTVKYINQEVNSGLSVTRNNGIQNSSGEYIYMLDSDDYITPDCIERLLATALETNAEITVGETICHDSKDGKEKMYFPILTPHKILEGTENIYRTFVDGEWPIIAPNKLYKKEFILKNNLAFVKGLFSQDELWTFHYARFVNKMAFLKGEITYIYFLHGESTIFNRTKKNFENYQTIVEHFTASYKAEKNENIRILMKRKIIMFKEMVLIFLWKTMKEDKAYFKENVRRLMKAPKFSLADYFSKSFTVNEKKKNFFLNLPPEINYRFFKWRYERGS